MYAVPISLIQVLGAILDLYAFILIARALISWVSPDPRNKIVQFLYQITEPVLAPVRQVVPPIGGLDLSLVVVLIVIQVLRAFLIPY
jgi:YggT family protein